ncbi:cell wall-binding protein [Clostridium sp.]|uniref:cell wall-binding protein n=1 Tax=Clostridium sp. TaxID=1506 RepID=UPI00262A91AA|nr:cell wall-binding protein [Clostridium sp.]
MIKKIVCSLLIATSVIMIVPIGVSAEWKHDNTGWWYKEGDSYSTGWKQIGDSWYYFGKDGYMKNGWILDGAWWYYLQENGVMATGKVLIKGQTYEFNSNGRWINNGLPNGTTTSDLTEGINTNASTSTSKPPSMDKMKKSSDFSWFNENGNTYFKIIDDNYLSNTWNVDGDIYLFDENGVVQKGEYTDTDGEKYLFGSDGKFIKCISDENYKLWADCAITTKSSANNFDVTIDDSNMMNIVDVLSEDPAKNGVMIKGDSGYELDKTQPKATVKGKTLYCKTNQSIYLDTIKVSGTDTDKSLFPNLIVISDSSDTSIAYSGIDLGLENGYFRNIYPKIMTKKTGKTTITININGTKTSFDVVVTE